MNAKTGMYLSALIGFLTGITLTVFIFQDFIL